MKQYLGWKKYKRYETDKEFILVNPRITGDEINHNFYQDAELIGLYDGVEYGVDYVFDSHEYTDGTLYGYYRTNGTNTITLHNEKSQIIANIKVQHCDFKFSTESNLLIPFEEFPTCDIFGAASVDICDIVSDFSYNRKGIVLHTEADYLKVRMAL